MFPNLGPIEMIMVMGIAILLFGKRLPEVGRSLGKGIVEFKKGLSGVAEEVRQVDAPVAAAPTPAAAVPAQVVTTTPGVQPMLTQQATTTEAGTESTAAAPKQ